MIHVLDLSIEDLQAAVAASGQPPYRADPLADWVYKKGVTDPAAMTNLPAAMKQQTVVMTSKVVARRDSDDGTIKLLLEYADKDMPPQTATARKHGTPSRVECVLIPTETRATACLSTQVGCAMGCAFCASGRLGMERNLTAGEILQQILHLQQALRDTPGVHVARPRLKDMGEPPAGGLPLPRITHVVFMGMGEPLANYENTLASVRAIVDPERLGVSARHVTISTVGIPRAIRRLAHEDLPVTLAISLHAPDDVLRKQLIPSAERFGIDEILAAAQELFEAATAGRSRWNTCCWAGSTTRRSAQRALAKIVRRVRCNVNVIRYNPVPELPYRKPAQAAVQAFLEKLQRAGVNAHLRKSQGADAEAACGQLKRMTNDAMTNDTINDE